jgi:hypothetical protein
MVKELMISSFFKFTTKVFEFFRMLDITLFINKIYEHEHIDNVFTYYVLFCILINEHIKEHTTSFSETEYSERTVSKPDNQFYTMRLINVVS